MNSYRVPDREAWIGLALLASGALLLVFDLSNLLDPGSRLARHAVNVKLYAAWPLFFAGAILLALAAAWPRREHRFLTFYNALCERYFRFLWTFAWAAVIGILVLNAVWNAEWYDEEIFHAFAMNFYLPRFENRSGLYCIYGPIGHLLYGWPDYVFGPSFLAGRVISVVFTLLAFIVIARLVAIGSLPRPLRLLYPLLLFSSLYLLEAHATYNYYAPSLFLTASCIALLGKIGGGEIEPGTQRPWGTLFLFSALCVAIPYVRITNFVIAVALVALALWRCRAQRFHVFFIVVGVLVWGSLCAILFPAYTASIGSLHAYAIPFLPNSYARLLREAHRVGWYPTSWTDEIKYVAYSTRQHLPMIVFLLVAFLHSRWRQISFVARSAWVLSAIFYAATILSAAFAFHQTGERYAVYGYGAFLIAGFGTLASRTQESSRGLGRSFANGLAIFGLLVVLIAAQRHLQQGGVGFLVRQARPFFERASFNALESELDVYRRNAELMEKAIPIDATVWPILCPKLLHAFSLTRHRTFEPVWYQYAGFVMTLPGAGSEENIEGLLQSKGFFNQRMLAEWLGEKVDYVLLEQRYFSESWNPATCPPFYRREVVRAYYETVETALRHDFERVAPGENPSLRALAEQSVVVYRRRPFGFR